MKSDIGANVADGSRRMSSSVSYRLPWLGNSPGGTCMKYNTIKTYGHMDKIGYCRHNRGNFEMNDVIDESSTCTVGELPVSPQHVQIFNNICKHLTILENIFQCMQTYVNNCKHLTIFANILQTFGNILQTFDNIFKHSANICKHSVNICKHSANFDKHSANIFKHLETFCQHLQTFTNICKHVQICENND